MRSGNARYWQSLLENTNNSELKILTFFTWATPKTILSLLKTVNDLVESLTEHQKVKIEKAILRVARISIFTTNQRDELDTALKENGTLSDYVKYLISLRVEESDRANFVFFQTDSISDQKILNLKLEYLVNAYLRNPSDKDVLLLIKNIYSRLTIFTNKYMFQRTMSRAEHINIPLETARSIMDNSRDYPRIIAAIAERSCKSDALKRTIPVGEIAKNNRWFE